MSVLDLGTHLNDTLGQKKQHCYFTKWVAFSLDLIHLIFGKNIKPYCKRMRVPDMTSVDGMSPVSLSCARVFK